MSDALRIPNFSVIAWVRMNEKFGNVRSELLIAAGVEPNEMTEYQGMADFHWSVANIFDARKLAEALRTVAQHPEVVLLRISSLVDNAQSVSIKDERLTKH